MEEDYMVKIESIYGLIKNQNLSSKERQDKVLCVLRDMRKEVEEWQKINLNNHIQESVKRALDEVLK